MMMELDSRLFVFSTQRAIAQFYTSKEKGLMPKAMGIGELFSHAFFVPHTINPNAQMCRVILHTILRDLLTQNPALTQVFVFEKSFLGYLQGSDFLLPFFRELASHNVAITDIPLRDIYADYEEHLLVLEEIYKRFNSALDSLGLARFNAKEEIVSSFVKSFQSIELYLDGFVNPREQAKLLELSKHTTLRIHFRTDTYNAPYFLWLSSEIQPNRAYTITLNNTPEQAQHITQNIALHNTLIHNSLLESNTITTTPPPIEVFSFELRMAQCSFVLEKVRELLHNGVKGDDILIITPDESFSEYFALLDSAHNLNYAMGKPITSSPKHRTHLELLREILQTDIFTTLATRLNPLILLESIFAYLFNSTSDDTNTLEAAHKNALQSLIPSPIPAHYQTQIMSWFADYRVIWSVMSDCSYEQILELLFLQIQSLSLDDTQGGKVRVMGILETRGLECLYAIIVDCNQGFIPRISDSDMFLNTAIRESLGMPSVQDRENLQKHYYYQLLLRTKKQIFITTTHNEESKESSLLDELRILHKDRITHHDGDSLYALFAPSVLQPYVEEEIVDSIAHFAPKPLQMPSRHFNDMGEFIFSATSLWDFMTCKRKFYYRYLLQLKAPQKDSKERDIGNMLHKALEIAYNTKLGIKLDYDDLQTIQARFQSVFHIIFTQDSSLESLVDSALDSASKSRIESYMKSNIPPVSPAIFPYTKQFEYEQMLELMGQFWQIQHTGIAKYATRTMACEASFTSVLTHNAMSFPIIGKCDRIDLQDTMYHIIDYKLTINDRNKKKILTQLAFYALALESPSVCFTHHSTDSADGVDSTKSLQLESTLLESNGVRASAYALKTKNSQDSTLSLSLEQKESLNSEIFEALRESRGVISFDKTLDNKPCAYCEYALMCNRA